MRISTHMAQQMGIQALLDRHASLAKTELQIATGRRILTPSDDPAGATRALGIDRFIATLDQYDRNGEEARARLSLEETTLANVVTVLQRLRELAVQANNDTLDAAARQGLAEEANLRLDELLSLANTRTANGEYLFSGFQSDTQPFDQPASGTFTYSGDQGTRLLQISASRQVVDRDAGLDVFMDARTASGGVQDIFTTAFNFAANLSADTPTGTDIDDIDSAMNHILTVQTQVGARLSAIESQVSVNAAHRVEAQTTLSSIVDLDFAEAISRFNEELLAFQAAEQAYAKVQGLSLFNFL